MMAKVVVPNELKEASMLHQARSIELIDKNKVLLALQKLIASIAKVLGEMINGSRPESPTWKQKRKK